MTITWYGNTCVGLSVKPWGGEEKTLLFFPHSRTSRARTLEEKSAALLEDYYGDGAAPEKAPEGKLLITHAGEYERAGFTIHGIAIVADAREEETKKESRERPLRRIAYTAEAEDIRVCHLGAMQKQKLSDEELEQIGAIDVLLLPVGGGPVMHPKQAAGLLEQLEPRILIPIAFRTEYAKHLLPLETFLKEIGGHASKERPSRYSLKAKDMPSEGMQVAVLEPQ